MWQPIKTVPEGVHVLLWFAVGERGSGGMEAGTVFWDGCDLDMWTHGGPNSGTDWYMAAGEIPTYWMPLPEPPEGNAHD